jgi:hypothetical protein
LARFTCQSLFGCSDYSIWIRRNNDGKVIQLNIAGITWNGQSVYTAQLFDGGGYSAHACISDIDHNTACTADF